MSEIPSRRGLLKAAGGLTIGFLLPTAGAGKAMAAAAAGQAPPPPGTPPPPKPINPNAFIEINPTGPVRLILPYVEMGQGAYTGQAMLLAEELDVGMDQIELVPASPNPDLYGRQSTGGSTTTRTAWKSMREAAAVGREKLVTAAGRQWNVPVTELTTDRGVVTHAASGRTATYGSLAAAAMATPNPMKVTVKDPSTFKILGKSHRRLDTPDKVRGKALYAMDIMLPGMKVAAVKFSPTLLGDVTAVDDAAARAIPGVQDVVTIPNAVAVIADNYWIAQKGLNALKVSWSPGPVSNFSTENWKVSLGDAHRSTPALEARNEGDLTAQGKRVEAIYELPMLAHATMEPTNAVVWVKAGSCEVWIGNQNPVRMRAAAAQVCGLPEESVTIHSQYLGGGFGRRVFVEGVTAACQIAKQVSYPVKVIWSREEDIKTDIFRPQVHNALSATLGEDGMPLVWTHRVTCGSVGGRYSPLGLDPGKLDNGAVEGAREPPYHFPGMKVEWVRHDPPDAITLGFWRGVGPTHNLFPVEGFMDELAFTAGKDPLEYRRALISKEHPRALGVLNAVADKFGWKSANPASRVGCGVAVAEAFGSYIAGMIEVEVSPQGVVKIRRCAIAIDCGRVVNPNSIMAQMEGGIIFGWTAALFGEVSVKNGAIQQTNFHDYRMMRLDETPPIETVIIDSTEKPGGVGEASTVLAAPLLTNAIFAATGVRLRSLPIDSSKLIKKSADTKVSAVLPLAGLALAALTASADEAAAEPERES